MPISGYMMMGSAVWYAAIAVAYFYEGKGWTAGTMLCYAASVLTFFMAATQ